MSNQVKKEMNKIDIPKELHDRSKMGILQAKKEKRRPRLNGMLIAAGLLVVVGGAILSGTFFNHEVVSDKQPVVNEDGSIEIPALHLPDNAASADMIGLIVYQGKIYTQTSTEIDFKDAKALLGEKLGRTKGNIDEWSSQDEYAKEFASTIGESDVYAVKGYDTDFRIMAYVENGENVFIEFYEHLNGITVQEGKDVFGKLKMTGNIEQAQYRTYDDWNYNVNNFHPINDLDTVTHFVKVLNQAQPYLRTSESDPIGEYRNNQEYRELTVQLKDGSKVHLTLLKGGYIYYGFSNVYFKLNENQFSPIWTAMEEA